MKRRLKLPQEITCRPTLTHATPPWETATDMAPTQGRTAPPDREQARDDRLRRSGGQAQAGRQGQEAQAQSGEPERPASHPIERRQSQTSSRAATAPGRNRASGPPRSAAGRSEAPSRVDRRRAVGGRPRSVQVVDPVKAREPGWPGKPGRPAPPWSGPPRSTGSSRRHPNSRLTNPVKPAACVISSNTPVVSPVSRVRAAGLRHGRRHAVQDRHAVHQRQDGMAGCPRGRRGECQRPSRHRRRRGIRADRPPLPDGKVMDDVEGESRSTSANSPRSSRMPCRNDRLSMPASAAASGCGRSRLERIHPDHVGVRKRLRNRRGSDTGAAPDVDNGRPAWRRSVMASIESRMTGTRKALCPPAPIAAWVACLGPVFVPGHADATGERLDRAVDLMLGDGRPKTPA